MQLNISVSESLRHHIQQALTTVYVHPQHDLTLGWRWAIWAALDGEQTEATTLYSIGHRRRTLLAITSVRYLLPMWLRVYPNDLFAQHVLTRAQYALEAGVSSHHTEQELTRFLEEAECFVGGNSEQDIVGTIATAAAYAYATVVTDEHFERDNIDLTLTDTTVDAYEWDVAGLCAAIYAHGITSDPEADHQKRQQFWVWWLTDAVPQAWAAFPEDST